MGQESILHSRCVDILQFKFNVSMVNISYRTPTQASTPASASATDTELFTIVRRVAAWDFILFGSCRWLKLHTRTPF